MEQLTGNVTFKMRTGKKVEFGFYAFFSFILAAFGVFVIRDANGGDLLDKTLLLLLFSGFISACAIIFLLSLFRARLSLSDQELFFQGPVFNVQASREDLKGFIQSQREIYLIIERMQGKKQVRRNNPITWFTKLRMDNKPYKSEVLDSLRTFAPKFFNITEETGHSKQIENH